MEAISMLLPPNLLMVLRYSPNEVVPMPGTTHNYVFPLLARILLLLPPKELRVLGKQNEV
jgi:hypothetical protein